MVSNYFNPFIITNVGDNEPLLYVDVNLGQGVPVQRIVVYEGDTADGLADKFCKEYSLNEEMKEKLTQLLKQQMSGVLEKIDEEQASNSSDINNNEWNYYHVI